MNTKATHITTRTDSNGQQYTDRYEARKSPAGEWGMGIWDRLREQWICTGVQLADALRHTNRLNEADAYGEESGEVPVVAGARYETRCDGRTFRVRIDEIGDAQAARG